MSALHDAPVPRGAVDFEFRPAETGTLNVWVEPAFAWPTPAQAFARSPWQRLARRVYRWLTPELALPTLANLGQLGARIWRGAQPGAGGFKALAELGVQTVINLRLEAPEEEDVVRSHGMDYLYFPLDPLAAPTHAHVLAFLHTVCDPARGQVFFHCYHGADRTGVLAACYRLAHDGWPLADALAELGQHRFHYAFQQAMFAYVREFECYWQGLPADVRDQVLRRSPACIQA